MKHKIRGKGPVIILLRGLGRTLEYWLDFEHELAKDFRVVMIDLPGVNEEKERTPLTIKTTVKLLVKKIDQLRPEIGEPPYHFFGLSFGGLSAMGIAYYNPELVDTLTIASSSITQLESKRINLIPLLSLLMMELEPGRPPYPNKKIGEYLVSPKYLKEHPEIIRLWDRIWATQELTKVNFISQLVAALFSLTPEMTSRIKAPTMVISGEDDLLVPLENSEIIKNCIPNSIHIRVPEAGHDITTEKPFLIAEMIRDFTRTKDLESTKTKFQEVKQAPELLQLKRLEKRFGDIIILEQLGEVEHKGYKSPINAFFISHKPRPELPTIAFFSCFHGVGRRRDDREGLAVIRAATGGVETLADGDLIGRIGHCLEDGTAQPTGGTGKGILRDSHAGERRYAPDEYRHGKYSNFEIQGVFYYAQCQLATVDAIP